jgi:hypothetical protein
MNDPAYGWVPDDDRLDDLDFAAPFGAGPRVVTHNRDVFDPPKFSQGSLGYCTDYAGARARWIVEYQQTGFNVQPSPIFSAWVTRLRTGQQGQNVGASIRDSAEGAILTGVASEFVHPSEMAGVPNTVRAKVKPLPEAFREAGDHQILKSYVIADGNVDAIHEALVAGFPVHFGMYLGRSFDNTGATGIAPPWDGSRINPHSMILRDADQVGGKWGAWGDNSWGPGWGMGGSFFLDDEHLSRLMDIRVYTKIEVFGS